MNEWHLQQEEQETIIVLLLRANNQEKVERLNSYLNVVLIFPFIYMPSLVSVYSLFFLSKQTFFQAEDQEQIRLHSN